MATAVQAEPQAAALAPQGGGRQFAAVQQQARQAGAQAAHAQAPLLPLAGQEIAAALQALQAQGCFGGYQRTAQGREKDGENGTAQRHGLGFRNGDLLFRPPGETLRSG